MSDMYDKPNYDAPNYEEAAASSDMTSNQDYLSMVDSLKAKNTEQSNNLIQQREIINKAYNENKALKDEIASLKEQINRLNPVTYNAPVEQTTPNYSPINEEFMNEFSSMKSQLENMQRQKLEQELLGVMNVFKDEFGVEDTEMRSVFDTLAQEYDIDWTKSPNMKRIRAAMREEGFGQVNEGSLPRGGYNAAAYQAQRQAQYDEWYAAKKAEALRAIEERKQQRRNRKY